MYKLPSFIIILKQQTAVIADGLKPGNNWSCIAPSPYHFGCRPVLSCPPLIKILNLFTFSIWSTPIVRIKGEEATFLLHSATKVSASLPVLSILWPSSPTAVSSFPSFCAWPCNRWSSTPSPSWLLPRPCPACLSPCLCPSAYPSSLCLAAPPWTSSGWVLWLLWQLWQFWSTCPTNPCPGTPPSDQGQATLFPTWVAI